MKAIDQIYNLTGTITNIGINSLFRPFGRFRLISSYMTICKPLRFLICVLARFHYLTSEPHRREAGHPGGDSERSD